ncbi:hypothetical protein Ciccas_002838, partial [Cichlidogyrus casuarinus]
RSANTFESLESGAGADTEETRMLLLAVINGPVDRDKQVTGFGALHISEEASAKVDQVAQGRVRDCETLGAVEGARYRRTQPALPPLLMLHLPLNNRADVIADLVQPG